MAIPAGGGVAGAPGTGTSTSQIKAAGSGGLPPRASIGALGVAASANLPYAGIGAGQGAGNQPVGPVTPPAGPAGIPAAPGAAPDGGEIIPGAGPGGAGAAGGAAILTCACLLVLGCARRGYTADAPSTSAILCPDEVPG
jgi:hypothetical protein